jgi:hypothetical protein
MANKLKEYSGHHTMKKASPRPFIDDEAELNNYLEKNRYGGEGNHYSKDSAMPNPNRTRFTKFEENMNEDNVRPQVENDVERFLTAILKKYKDNGYTAASIAQVVDQSLTRMRRKNMGEVEYKVADASDAPSNLDDDDTITIDPNLKENKMKKSDLLKDYMSSRKETNLNEQMEIHRKEAKRGLLMEGALKQFFELFEMGRTDEEIVLDYASKGVQVPEQFVSKARGQYEGLKKMKLELEMSEKEFKNSAKDIVNNPDEQVVNSENKPLSSGIYGA